MAYTNTDDKKTNKFYFAEDTTLIAKGYKKMFELIDRVEIMRL